MMHVDDIKPRMKYAPLKWRQKRPRCECLGRPKTDCYKSIATWRREEIKREENASCMSGKKGDQKVRDSEFLGHRVSLLLENLIASLF
jgi:hypothetical protein